MTKQAWYHRPNGDGYRQWEAVELTGRCKKTTGGPHLDEPVYNVEIKYPRAIFAGYNLEWVHKDYIKICDVVTEEIYECNCFKDKENAENLV